MSQDKSRSQRVAPLLPPDSGRDRPLFAVAAILVFLACLSAFGAAGAWRAADGWTDQLTAEITVAHTRSPMTLRVVRHMSRKRSTPMMRPMPSGGTPTLPRIRATTGSEPAGTPAVPIPARMQITIT